MIFPERSSVVEIHIQNTVKINHASNYNYYFLNKWKYLNSTCMNKIVSILLLFLGICERTILEEENTSKVLGTFQYHKHCLSYEVRETLHFLALTRAK